MKYKNILYSMIALMCSLLLTNCNNDMPLGDYDAAEVGKIKKVVPGTIISMRPVRLHNKNDDNLTVQTGTSIYHGTADNGFNRSSGFEYVIRLNSGGIISVVQAEHTKLKNKQHILVIYGTNTRVVPDHGGESY